MYRTFFQTIVPEIYEEDLTKMKTIKLTRDKFAIVDDCDFEAINKMKWYCTNAGYAVHDVGSRTILMHRLVLDAPEGFEVDHIDGNPLNNSRNNLRLATHQENIRHRVNVNKNNSSGVNGVSWFKRDKKWRARIFVDGKEIHLGLFNSKAEAIIKRNKASEKYYGDFGHIAKLN